MSALHIDSSTMLKASISCLASQRALVCAPPPLAALRQPRTSLALRAPIRTGVIAQSAVDDSLRSVLKDEIKYEKEYYRKDEALLGDAPNGFDVDNPTGKSAFYLLKEHKSESIVIEVDLDNQPGVPDDDDHDEGTATEEDEEEILPVTFRVSISKGNAALIFECESDGEYLSINHIAHEPSPKEDQGDEDEADDTTPDYTGPVFEELDDTLQQAFLDYLEERGVTAELGGYLRLLCVDKMEMEYQAWLGKVKDFVAQP